MGWFLKLETSGSFSVITLFCPGNNVGDNLPFGVRAGTINAVNAK